MKMTALLLFVAVSNVHAAAFGQSARVNVQVKDASLEAVFAQIRRQSELTFTFNIEDIAGVGGITLDCRDCAVEEVLARCLKGTGLTYRIADNVVVLRREESRQTRQQPIITGIVRDASGNPLPGVAVLIKGTQTGTTTDGSGKFALVTPPAAGSVLVFSYLGKKPVEAEYEGELLSVTMYDDVAQIDEVVITGIFERKAESFTGSATVIKKEELMRNGSQNIFHSLKNIDPSFRIIEDLEYGSDPNRMPTIQMRGQQGIPDIKGSYTGNPNQPLFILDGFEASQTTVFDLDMNRVETVVLLKDAAAKAIYGARAANGVVVIETRRPQPGTLNISYKGDLNITVPDLTGYNLCNAWEKYLVERDNPVVMGTLEREKHLNDVLADITRGVDTYWLSKPLHVGVGHRHSLTLEGGDDKVRYGADIMYNSVSGAMKGSDRKTFTGGFTLSYRYRNLLFRNQFNVSLNRGDDSPYGEFSEYTRLNPYWTPYDGEGNLKQIAGVTGGGGIVETPIGNPLWNVSIGTSNFSKYTELVNNLYIEWDVIKSLKLVGRLGLSKNQSTREDFYPASHTRFANYGEDKFSERGTYDQTHADASTVRADLNANYSLLARGHQLYLNAGVNIQQDKGESVSHSVMGFPNDKLSFIGFGKGYALNGRPTGSESISREIGLMAAMNYSYDDRYLADLSYRASASSLFGRESRWGQFWSAGIGWNLHREHFMREARWLRQFKVRASTGYTGSQNFNPYQALATFQYYQTQVYDSWIGSYLLGLPNDDLRWQKTQDFNIGFDLNLWGRLSIKYDFYIQNTRDQLLDLTIPPSMGFTSYKENLGSTQNRGMELRLNAHLIYNPEKDRYLSVSLSMAGNRNKMKKISNALKSYNDSNDQQLQTGSRSEVQKPLLRYEEGQSMNAIWAVRSLGIDPSSGDELFRTRDGRLTTEWNAADQVVCGDQMPKASGNFGVNMQWEGVSVNLSFYYQFGGQIYNQTLVDRVENADIYFNVDKRILNSVWKQADDKVSFAYRQYRTTKPSSRFIQDLNELRLATLNVGYDFKGRAFLRTIGLKGLKATFYMDDVFRLSSVKIERGLSYPFARTFSLSLQASF